MGRSYSAEETGKIKEICDAFFRIHEITDFIHFFESMDAKYTRKQLIRELATLGINRRKDSVMAHARRLYHPNNKKGPYTKEEDELIMKMVKQHGHNWLLIGEAMDRMGESVRDRYWKEINKAEEGKWSEEEEERLKSIIKSLVGEEISKEALTKAFPWTKIAQLMKTRTARQCRKKWAGTLMPLHVWAPFQPGQRDQLPETIKAWTFQDDYNLFQVLQSQDVIQPRDIYWKKVSDDILYAIEKNGVTYIRYFSAIQAKTRFFKLRKDVPNGHLLSVGEICCHYLANEGQHLLKHHLEE